MSVLLGLVVSWTENILRSRPELFHSQDEERNEMVSLLVCLTLTRLLQLFVFLCLCILCIYTAWSIICCGELNCLDQPCVASRDNWV